MTMIAALVLMVGCTQECPTCETAPSACAEGLSCGDPTAVERTQLGTMNHPIGDGPTEIWRGTDLVGVGFRKNGVEDIVMFTQPIEHGTDPTPCVAPRPPLQAYPAYLSPHHAPSGSGDSSLTFKRLQKCSDGKLVDCGLWDCFQNAGAFLHPGTGVFKVIGDRIGQQASYVSNPSNWQRARGAIPAFQPFDNTECLSQTSFYDVGESHTDKAILPKGGAEVEVGWEFVGLWGGTDAPQEALVVFRKPYDVINTLSHQDWGLGDGNSNGQGDEFCSYVNSQCATSGGQATCWMTVIGFSYP